MSEKTRERLLYLMSPIALLVIWQILLMLGFGDRRFSAATSRRTPNPTPARSPTTRRWPTWFR